MKKKILSTVLSLAMALSLAAPALAAEYTVAKGDTLWGIARRFYGDGSRYTELARKNNLSNPNLIYPGQVLVL